jgi:D-alanyl-D-alanine carboxypeptidase
VKKAIAVLVIMVPLLGGGMWLLTNSDRKGATSTTSNNQGSSQSNQVLTPAFDKKQFSLTDPESKWVIVNKKNPIPVSYVPDLTVPDVRLRLSSADEQMKINTQTASAIKEMFEAAKKEGITLVFGSGYRSANKQAEFYNSYKARDGQAAADTFSARPGYSEHQTGFAVDLTSSSGTCHLEECWKDTPEGKWAAVNAYKYGFILRYLSDKQAITGYTFEPWHFRFVGKELAGEIQKSSQTLEEFFEYPTAQNYD